MRCNEVQQSLRRASLNGDLPRHSDLFRHLEECLACREDWEIYQLQWHLADLPAPELRPDFTESALDLAWKTREGRRVSRPSVPVQRFAIAASVVLAVVITLSAPWWGPEQPAMTSTVHVAPQRVSQVDLLMTSTRALPDAIITVEMDEGIALEGYPALHRLRWRAPLMAGENRLSLPVQLQGGEGGVIVVGIESGGLRKEMTLAVEADGNYTPAKRPI